ncbi:MAG: FAD-binding oxidoreductase [Chloroflexota bacterium]
MEDRQNISPRELGEISLRELKPAFRGELLRPGDAGYDAARAIFNGMIDRRPALIARCAGVADVVAAVAFARDHGLLVAVRGGGHNVAGNALCDGGLVIDLSRMKGVRVDPGRRTAHAQAGLLWGELDHETQSFGLAVTGGIASTTGIAGFTLGGGMGWLARKHGLACDNLLSIDLVLADGSFVTASASDHPDLFWGVRGGGGNFGVATSFEYRLHPVGPSVLAGTVVYRADEAAAVLRRYRDYVMAAPDELMTIVSLRIAPPAPYLPPEIHGTPILGILACYVGAVDAGERIVDPLRRLGSPVADTFAPKPYVAHQQVLDPLFPAGLRNYWKANYLADLEGAAIDTVLDQFSRISSPRTGITIWQLGGAASRVGVEDTAYAHRDANFALNIPSLWVDPAEDEKHIRWTRECFEAMQAYSTGGVYVNFLGNEGDERVRAAYTPKAYARLAELKSRYDPTNFFRLNQNIRPDREGGSP